MRQNVYLSRYEEERTNLPPSSVVSFPVQRKVETVRVVFGSTGTLSIRLDMRETFSTASALLAVSCGVNDYAIATISFQSGVEGSSI